MKRGDSGPSNSGSDLEPAATAVSTSAGDGSGWWKILPLVILVLGLGVPLAFRTGKAAGTVQVAPTPTVVAAQAIIGAIPVATADTVPAPAPSPRPTPTPDPIRPLFGPSMPRVVDSGPAPLRKPGSPDPTPSTDHVIIVDGASGAILFQRNADEPVAPASLTKIITAVLGIEHGDPSDHVKIDVDARQMAGGSLMGLGPGFDVTFQDLLYGLLLPSGNDAALAIARYVAGSDDAFVRLMNQKARWLGLKSTHFANPHGLDTSDHYSCPYDMVVMARYAMQYPLFRQIVDTKSYEVKESNIDFMMYNVNPILDYPGADGVKTGLTDSAGKALVAAAARNGHTVYVAFMRSEGGALADGTLLLNWAFDSFTWPDDGSGQAAPER